MIGNYKILGLLGEGGFGRTYLAQHALLKRNVVIKQALFKSNRAREILLSEASVLWDVNHFALPTVKDVLENEHGDLLLVMSHVPGDELGKKVAADGPLSAEDVCWITQRILSALYYLHFRGVVHRDVKPANIIADFETHIATLVDFGLSRLKPDGSPDESGYTPFFSAPEQIEGKSPIPESDVFALGVTMTYLLGGDYRTRSLPANIPAPLASFIADLLTENPLDRPKCCKTLNKRLSDIRRNVFKRNHTR